jgi:hypothetical protein
MHHTHDTGIFTTLSGMLGGLFKAASGGPLLTAVTLGSLSGVVLYAAASAAVGYVVKRVLDRIVDRFSKKSNSTGTREDHE